AEAVTDSGGDGGGSLIPLYNTQRSWRCQNRKVGRRGNGQGDGDILLNSSAVTGHGDGIGSRWRARPYRDGHGRVSGTRGGNSLRVEAHSCAGRHAGSRQS